MSPSSTSQVLTSDVGILSATDVERLLRFADIDSAALANRRFSDVISAEALAFEVFDGGANGRECAVLHLHGRAPAAT